MPGAVIGGLVAGNRPADVIGPGRIADVLTVDGSPARRRIRLHDRASGRLLCEAWSDPLTGAWAMTGLALGREYVVYALDHPDATPGEYNAMILDRVTAALP